MDIPDDPSKPCLSCTKQWCLNQNLPKCAGASLGDANPDTATGKEGDIEARCFRAFRSDPDLPHMALQHILLILPPSSHKHIFGFHTSVGMVICYRCMFLIFKNIEIWVIY